MKIFKRIISILTILAGIAVIYFGTTLLSITGNHAVGTGNTSISAGYHSVDNASFGADFYTYIYKGVYSVAKGMNDVQQGIESAVAVQNDVRKEVAGNTRAVDELIQLTSRVGGYVVISIGLLILFYGLQCTADSFLVSHVVIDNLPVPVYSAVENVVETREQYQSNEVFNPAENTEAPTEESAN